MEAERAERRLELFGIPGGAMRFAPEVRRTLARLVSAGELSLGELQTARDIVRRCRCGDAWAYLFLAGMFASLRSGNAAFNPAREWSEELGTRGEAWESARAAAEALKEERRALNGQAQHLRAAAER